MKSTRARSVGSRLPSLRKTEKPHSADTGSRIQQSTQFRLAYDRHDLPIRVDHVFRGPKLCWTKGISDVDYERLLPIFCDGLCETKFPYDFMAEEGLHQMIDNQPEKVLSLIPYIVQPLKGALRSHDTKIVIRALKIVKKMATKVSGGGEALVPYYRQLLPVLGQYRNRNKNLGDAVEYGQWKQENLADLIEETLQILEMNGGSDAFINIRYMIPMYQSCMGNR